MDATPELDASDYQRSLWTWLKLYTAEREDLPELHLGWGTEDDFAKACGLLTPFLPPERLYRFPGGHQWDPWRKVFGAFLASGALSKPSD